MDLKPELGPGTGDDVFFGSRAERARRNCRCGRGDASVRCHNQIGCHLRYNSD